MSRSRTLKSRPGPSTRARHGCVFIGVAAVASLLLFTGESAAQSGTCTSTDVPASLVRIVREPPLPSGTGIVIVRRSNFAIVLTAKHVVQDPGKGISVFFAAAMDRSIPVPWTDANVFGFPLDGDLALFRVNAPVPAEVVPEDPFTGELAMNAPLVAWGYPAQGATAFCSYEGRFQGPSPSGLLMDRFVASGVSGGPMFFRDPDGTLRLIGIVNRGDGDARSGRAFAIDVRQAVALASSSPDSANDGKPHPWPNIVLATKYGIDTDQFAFLLVAAGDFEMGSTDKDSRWPASNGLPAGPRRITLPAFYLSQYEVTAGQYRRCQMAEKADERCMPAKLGATVDNFPVVGVTWYQAKQYAHWLDQRLRVPSRQVPRDLRRLLDAGWTIDLPSEAEWEKGARFDKTGMYPWGKDFKTQFANFNTNSVKTVGSTRCPDCAYGLADMAGNAREWTRSLKFEYPYVASKAEDDTASGKRVIRGGSAEDVRSFADVVLRAANRQDADPTAFDKFTGFRVALICRVERGCTWTPPD